MLRRWLEHPLMRGRDLDDPETTITRRRLIREKPFLSRIYDEWYRSIAALLPPGTARVLELGSGAGFLVDYIPGLLTSDILPLPGIDLVLDGHRLPFADGELRAIAMVDVLHHLPAAREFLAEAARTVAPGGALVMLEPWNTPWSRLVYRNLHHEPFDPDRADWEFPPSGPLSGANGALPWMIFRRDRARFLHEFPQWRIDLIRPTMPFRYLVSGGVSLRGLVPAWSFAPLRALEQALTPLGDLLAMFAFIRLLRTDVPARARSAA